VPKTLKQNYTAGFAYFVLSIICSALGDIMSKYLALSMNQASIVSAKFALSIFFLLPFAESINLKKNIKVHFARVVLLALGSLAWTYGLQGSQIATATTIKFTIPLFTMIFAYLFLREKIAWHQWVAAIVGFGGITFCMNAENRLDLSALFLIAGAVAFSLLDALNKAYIGKISNFETMLANALFVSLALAPLAWVKWQPIGTSELVVLAMLALDSVLIVFFLLKALEKANLSIIAPCRYIELLVTAGLGYVVFKEIPSGNDYLAAAIVICSSMWPVYQKKLLAILK
jgi:S-adenosylmethionine uptake transporter